MIFDFPRRMQNKDFWDLVEDTKSGCLTAHKYHGGHVSFYRIPHVLIFSNWPPPRYNCLSMDRLEVYKMVTEDGVFSSRLLDKDEVSKLSRKLDILNKEGIEWKEEYENMSVDEIITAHEEFLSNDKCEDREDKYHMSTAPKGIPIQDMNRNNDSRRDSRSRSKLRYINLYIE